MAYLTKEEVLDKINTSLLKNGVCENNARIVADVTYRAQLRGVTSHGMKMIPVYIERIRKGGLKPDATPIVEKKSNSVYIINGMGGFGQVAACKAAEVASEGISENEVRIVGINNTNHCGMLAYYTENIARNNGIGFMTTNTNPNTAAFGGAEKVLGTNPFSIAFPDNENPIVIDMATTSMAKGKIYEYIDKNMLFPKGTAINMNGEEVVDPNDALKGILLPFAGYKGYAISLAVELLSGVLTGAGYSKNVYSLHSSPEKQQNVGIFMACVPVGAFMGIDEYKKRTADFKSMVKNSRKAKDSGEIFFPGEIENIRKEKNIKDGIFVEDSILDQIDRL